MRGTTVSIKASTIRSTPNPPTTHTHARTRECVRGRPPHNRINAPHCPPRRLGGHSDRDTPGPIPNPEAKPDSADGTAPARVRESRTPPSTHHRVGPLRSTPDLKGPTPRTGPDKSVHPRAPRTTPVAPGAATPSGGGPGRLLPGNQDMRELTAVPERKKDHGVSGPSARRGPRRLIQASPGRRPSRLRPTQALRRG